MTSAHPLSGVLAFAAVMALAGLAPAQLVLFSDSFDRVSGTPDENGMIDDGNGGMMPNPLASTSWGANDNAAGGDITQTYEIGPEIRGGNRHQYVDGDVARFRAGWSEIQYDFAADPRVAAGGGLIIEFDATIKDDTNGWFAMAVGQTSEETTDTGDFNSIFLQVEDTVDLGVLFGGVNGSGVATALEVFEGGGGFTPVVQSDWGFGISPNIEQRFRVEIDSPDFAAEGATATANIFVTEPTFGTRQVLTNHVFDWDADGEVYVGFSSNKDQACGPADQGTCDVTGQDPTQEVEIDNLVISTLTTPVLGNGDYNEDGLVNAADYTVYRDTLGDTVTPLTGADGNNSGQIDAGDYAVWAANFGTAPGVSVAVPEPTSLASIACLLVLGAARRR